MMVRRERPCRPPSCGFCASRRVRSCSTNAQSSVRSSFASKLLMEPNSSLTQETNSFMCSFVRASISASVAVTRKTARCSQSSGKSAPVRGGERGRQRVALLRHEGGSGESLETGSDNARATHRCSSRTTKSTVLQRSAAVETHLRQGGELCSTIPAEGLGRTTLS